ncbi:MAG: Rieske 2Fe-2S domain-containing protein [Chitinophagaceae bacterium]|nr:Rieske 2Fe-2S domain-containing protein [Chitinophagaceae bacterium]
MGFKKYRWHKIAETPDEILFDENGLAEITVSNKKICLAKYQDNILGCAAQCPHAGGIMAEGYVDPVGNIVCPIHRYKFNLRNGRNSSGEGFYLKTYPVEIRADGVYAGMEEGGLFGLFK